MKASQVVCVVMTLTAISAALYATFKELPPASQDPTFTVKHGQWARAVEVIVDPETGCEYLLTSRGGITLRKGVNQFQTQCR
jgi:hypothetical protein